MALGEERLDARHEAAIVDGSRGSAPLRNTWHDELRRETPALCVEGFKAMDSAGGHYDCLPRLDGSTYLANAEQCPPSKEMNDFIARMVVQAEGPGEPVSENDLTMATVRLADRQRGSTRGSGL